jgi:hypothetical protein
MKLTCWTMAQGTPILIAADALPPIVRFVTTQHGQRLEADPKNFAQCLNAAARAAGDGLFVTLPPDTENMAPDWQVRLLHAAEQHPKGIFFYGDYHLQDGDCQKLQTVRADIGDITEREDWGPVWAVRTEWLNGIGGLDEQNHRAAFYDLLLKSWGDGQRVHVGGPLALISPPEADANAAALKDKLFFPGRGKLGGFSYLFMDPEDERHTENVFYNFLKREGAWLEENPKSKIQNPTANPAYSREAEEGAQPLSSQKGRSQSPDSLSSQPGRSLSPGALSSQPGRPLSPSPFPHRMEKGEMDSAIKVSVVTPVYNRARFIGKAIESVQQQTLTDWEYVIVDNGSTDDTREVVRSYAAKDSRVRLIENNVNVIALSLNLGVKAARGKYVSQLDSDDEYLPRTLEHMVEGLETHPNWGVAIGYYELMDEGGTSLPEFGIIKHLEYNRNNILRVDGAGAPRTWHRSVILEFGGFDEKELGGYGEDYDLVLKCGEKYEVGRVHEVCYRYRRHADNTDVLRDPEMKIGNKTLARLHALKRRKRQNAENLKR